MPKFLCQASYTAQGAHGLQQDGGSARRRAVQQMIEQAGGKLEAFYFALGEWDVYITVDLPDAATAAAISAAVSASGGARIHMVALLAPEEMDAALRKRVDYQAPGAGR